MKYFISTFILLASLLQAAPAIPTNAVTAETVTVLYNATNRVASLGPSNAVTLINGMIRTNATVTGISNAVVVIQANTNNWNTAYSWGNHYGLYRAFNWIPAWNDVTNKPTTFAPAPHDYTSVTNPPWITVQTNQPYAAQSGTAQVAVVALSVGPAVSNSFLRVYDSGGGVWKVLLPGEVAP